MKAIRALRFLAVAGALVASAVTPVATARPADRGTSAVELGAVNVLRGTHSAVIPVHVPTPAAFSGKVSDFSVKGAGRLPGFVLTTEPRTTTFDHPLLGPIESEPTQELVVAASRLPSGGVFGGSEEKRELILFPMETVIEPGNYLLYLIADGSPVTVTFELDGLLGTKTITPTERVPFVSKELPERTSVITPAGGMYTAGDYAPLRKPGLVFHTLSVEVEEVSAVDMGHCVYRGKPATEEELEDASYAPRCVNTSDEGYSTSFSMVRPDRPSGTATLYGAVSTLEADYWTQITEFEAAATVGDAGSLAYWLSW